MKNKLQELQKKILLVFLKLSKKIFSFFCFKYFTKIYSFLMYKNMDTTKKKEFLIMQQQLNYDKLKFHVFFISNKSICFIFIFYFQFVLCFFSSFFLSPYSKLSE